MDLATLAPGLVGTSVDPKELLLVFLLMGMRIRNPEVIMRTRRIWGLEKQVSSRNFW